MYPKDSRKMKEKIINVHSQIQHTIHFCTVHLRVWIEISREIIPYDIVIFILLLLSLFQYMYVYALYIQPHNKQIKIEIKVSKKFIVQFLLLKSIY